MAMDYVKAAVAFQWLRSWIDVACPVAVDQLPLDRAGSIPRCWAVEWKSWETCRQGRFRGLHGMIWDPIGSKEHLNDVYHQIWANSADFPIRLWDSRKMKLGLLNFFGAVMCFPFKLANAGWGEQLLSVCVRSHFNSSRLRAPSSAWASWRASRWCWRKVKLWSLAFARRPGVLAWLLGTCWGGMSFSQPEISWVFVLHIHVCWCLLV